MTVDMTIMQGPLKRAYGETVEYWRNGVLVRSITAVVNRKPSEELVDDMPGTQRPVLVVGMDNDSTTGISASDVNTGTDQIRCERVRGKGNEKFAIVGIGYHDAAWLQLGLR